jgi:hypothetical protein
MTSSFANSHQCNALQVSVPKDMAESQLVMLSSALSAVMLNAADCSLGHADYTYATDLASCPCKYLHPP